VFYIKSWDAFIPHNFEGWKVQNCSLDLERINIFFFSMNTRLEIHLMREHSFADGEGGSQVLAKKLLLRVLFEGADELTVYLNLIHLALFGDDVSGLLLLEDFSFAVTDLFGLGTAEVIVVQSVRNGNAGNVDLSLGGDDVDLVDSSKRASVNAERSGDEEKAGSQLLQEHDALSLVDAGEKDQHRSGSDGGTQLAVVLTERLFVGGLSLFAALGGQRARRLLKLNEARVAVLLSADVLRHRSRLLDHRGFLGLLVLDESGLLVIHRGSREPHDPSVNLSVAGSVNHDYSLV